MDGILLVDKPAGWTSHDVVAKVRSVIKKETGQKLKVGHTGTLDPAATGLMVLVIGTYTKRAQNFSKLDKIYEAELTFGSTSTTGDSEGEISNTSSKKPSLKEIQTVLNKLLGEIEQIPPAYSAVKIDGQRAYKAARAGKTVEIEPRKVKIYKITDVNYDYPQLKFTVKVSSGTYIRSLAADIGDALGTGAYLSTLRRTHVGDFKMGSALEVEDLSLLNIEKDLQK